MPTLQTPRLILRDYREHDLSAHHALMSDRAVMAFLPDLYCATLEDSRRNLEAAVREAALPPDARKLWFFRMETHGGQPVGSIGYTVTARAPDGMPLAQGNKLCDAGYFILPQFWGRGYTTEAFRAVLRFAFEVGGAHRLTATCNAENLASRAVMVKCGLVHEVTQKQHIWHDGRWCDRLGYRLLRREWEALAHPLPVRIVPYADTYRDDMLYCYLTAKAARGRAPRLRADLLDIPASYGERFWLALDAQDRVVGMVGIHMDTAPDAWLKRLFLRPDLKRRGLGTALLATAEARARASGAARLHTRFGDDFPEAPLFYTARGFADAEPSGGMRHMVKALGGQA